MSTHFIDELSGTLTREKGVSDSFTCNLEVVQPQREFDDQSGALLTIRGGVVHCDPLCERTEIAGGSIDIFGSSLTSDSPPIVSYVFRFTASDVEYLFYAESRDPIQNLKAIDAKVESTDGLAAFGTLSCTLGKQLKDFSAYPVLVQKMHLMSDALWRTLKLLAGVLLPNPLPPSGPSVEDVANNIQRFLGQASGTQVQVVRRLLQIISAFIPILELEINKIRQKVQVILDNEKKSLLRQALTGIHQIVVFAYYADTRADQLLGYARPQHKPKHQTTFPISNAIPNRLFDVVIAGTGPAGALLSDRLSSKGKSVLLLEAGPYIPEKDITPDELDSISRLYKNSGLQSAAKPSLITILQGACVGGGGIVNNGIFFPLSRAMLQNWRNAGFPFDSESLGGAYQVVAHDLNIGDIGEKAHRLNPVGQFLESALGPLQSPPIGPVDPGFYRMLVNLETLQGNGEEVGCRSTGLCNLGCGSERKVNSFQHYLKNALDGSRDVVLVPRASVVRAISVSGSSTRTVSAFEVRMADGSTARARGKSFVLCCGPIGSSAVLLRSDELLGVAERSLPVGRRFFANVASPLFATAASDVNVETSVQMCHVYVPPVGRNGFLIESWFSPPGGLALAMPGFIDVHAERMGNYPRLLSASPVVGTQAQGSITLSGTDVSIDLPVSVDDLDALRRGTILIVDALLQSEAIPVIVRLGNGRIIANTNDLSDLDSDMRQNVTPKDLHLLPMTTAHPQGGNALSIDPAIGVLNSDFRVRGIDNLHVCDGSVFPLAAGVNPQWTIFALAQLCAEFVQ